MTTNTDRIDLLACDHDEDATAVQMMEETNPELFERLAFHAELQTKALHRIEAVLYAKWGNSE